ncbi:MAG: hypothetical protein JXA57_06260 [Armatimonadetes bacterium]|nr:hypothetical protein [Armatimonadota bacterium]
MTMVRWGALAVLVAFLLVGGNALAQTGAWSLEQNAPEPFCNSEGGGTTIEFTVETLARITLDVWDADMTIIVRRLIEGELKDPGVHAVTWDGRDQEGLVVPDGAYPYKLVATSESGTSKLFQDIKTAHVQCETPVAVTAWGVIKALYR